MKKIMLVSFLISFSNEVFSASCAKANNTVIDMQANCCKKSGNIIETLGDKSGQEALDVVFQSCDAADYKEAVTAANADDTLASINCTAQNGSRYESINFATAEGGTGAAGGTK